MAFRSPLSFVVGTCVFLSLARCGTLVCFRLSYIEGNQYGCWLLVSLKKCGCCSSQKKKLSPSSPKEQFSKSSDKTSSTTGTSDAMFLVDMNMYPDLGPLASENSGQMIRFNIFRFLSGKKMQFHLFRKKLPKIHSNGKRSLSPKSHFSAKTFNSS